MEILKIGVIGTPGKWSSETLADELGKLTGGRHLFDLKDAVMDLETGLVRCGDEILNNFHGLIIKKISQEYSPDMLDRLEFLKFLEAKGVRIFSPTKAMERLINRLSCTVQLRASGMPMPATLVTENPKEGFSFLQEKKKIVFKPLYTSKARGMKILNIEEHGLNELAELQATHTQLYLQQFVDSPGQDLGITFIGGEYIGTYARVRNKYSWNTSTHNGGSYQNAQPPKEFIDLAYEAAKPFGMDFAAVDLVETSQGPMIYEVSAFGGFKGLWEAQGLNAAKLYARHAIKTLNRSNP